MAEDNNLPSVFEFSADVSTAPQPNPLPDGTYRGEIVTAERKVSPTSGNTYADISVRIDPNAFPVDWHEGADYPDGLIIHYRRTTIEDSPSGRFKLRRFTETAGLPKINKSLDLATWHSRAVKVEVKAEQSNMDNLMYASITRILAA